MALVPLLLACRYCCRSPNACPEASSRTTSAKMHVFAGTALGDTLAPVSALLRVSLAATQLAARGVWGQHMELWFLKEVV